MCPCQWLLDPFPKTGHILLCSFQNDTLLVVSKLFIDTCGGAQPLITPTGSPLLPYCRTKLAKMWVKRLFLLRRLRSSDDNFFKKLPSKVNVSESEPNRCSCTQEGGSETISCNDPAKTVFGYKNQLDMSSIFQKSYSNGRDQRSHTGYGDNEIGDYDLDLGENLPPANLTWPTPNKITQQQANESCTAAVTGSPVYGQCSAKMGHIEITGLIASCIIEVQV